MAQSKVEIIIEAVNRSNDEFQEVNRDLKKIDRSGQNTSGSMSGLEKAFNIARAAAGAFAVKEAARLVMELGELGAQAERAETTLVSVAGGAREAEVALNAVKEATNGTISDMEAMEQAATIMSLGLVNSSDQLGSVVRNVSALGSRFGGTMQTFQLMMSNDSLMRIDSFGIGVEEATKRIEEYKAAGMDASDAFDTAILELMDEKFQDLGGTLDDNATKIKQSEAAFQNLRQELGINLAGSVAAAKVAFGGLAQSLADNLGMMNDMTRAMGRAEVSAAYVAEKYGNQRGALEELNQRLAENAAVNDLAAGQMADYAEMAASTSAAQGGLNHALGEGADLMGSQSTYAQRAQEEYGKTSESVANFAQTIRENKEAQAEHARMLGEQAQAAGDLAMRLKDASEAQIAESLIGMLDPQEMGADAYSAAVTEIGTSFGLMDEQSIALAENLPKVAEAIQEGVIPAQNADEALGALVEDAADGVVNFEGLLKQFEQVPEKSEGVTEGVSNTIDPLERAAQAAQLFGNNLRAIPNDVNVNIHTGGSLPDVGGMPDIAMASGFEGVFNRPTTAVFGEAGPEYVYAEPVGAGGTAGAGFSGTVNINVSGAQHPQSVANEVMRKLRDRGLINRGQVRR